MELEFSTPDRMDFFDRLRTWIEGQKERLWISAPFVDELGISLLNSACRAKDTRLLSRRTSVLGDLNPDKIKVKNHEDLHMKFLLGDKEVYLGSPNLTYASLLNNIEVLLLTEKPKILSDLEEAFKVLWG